jgi:hypothetical protein
MDTLRYVVQVDTARYLLLTACKLLMLRTNLSEVVRKPTSDELVSVIHAPESFQNWVGSS